MKERTEKMKEIMKENSTKVTALNLPRTIHLVPMDHIDGFDVRPGFYETNGATAIPGGVNFTVYSHNASSIEPASFQTRGAGAFCSASFPGTLPDRKCIFHDRFQTEY